MTLYLGPVEIVQDRLDDAMIHVRGPFTTHAVDLAEFLIQYETRPFVNGTGRLYPTRVVGQIAAITGQGLST